LDEEDSSPSSTKHPQLQTENIPHVVGSVFIPKDFHYKTGTDTRDNITKKLIEILQTPCDLRVSYTQENKVNACQVAKDIEKVLSEKHRDTKGYCDKARSMIFNLRDPKNPKLKEQVLINIVSAKDMVTLGPKELASSEKQLEREEAQKANMDSRRTDWAKE
jgi:transcription elongation factor S-II